MNTSVCLPIPVPFTSKHEKRMASPNGYGNNLWQMPLLYPQGSLKQPAKNRAFNNPEQDHNNFSPNKLARTMTTPTDPVHDMAISNKVTLEDVMFQNERHGSSSRSDQYTVTDSCQSATPELQMDSRSPESETANNKKSKRSRNGCLTCRYRKKRCCETKPACRECSRLGLDCKWPAPGTENKNRSKNNRQSRDEMDHEVYGTIKILRGIVAYKSDE
ncbi:BA75_03051T0 [Komagataella pastoris]|uniref:BA75_03051T0 n=1 Tax=Komagataella pastoris TaxID=4922 RepID=A0A1B2JDQ2_PICPA|nr:BA75_03051T0 [Komagataella pastoris]